jgi:hypothetical protein
MDWFSFLVVAEVFLAIAAAYHIGKGQGLKEAVEKFGKKKEN